MSSSHPGVRRVAWGPRGRGIAAEPGSGPSASPGADPTRRPAALRAVPAPRAAVDHSAAVPDHVASSGESPVAGESPGSSSGASPGNPVALSLRPAREVGRAMPPASVVQWLTHKGAYPHPEATIVPRATPGTNMGNDQIRHYRYGLASFLIRSHGCRGARWPGPPALALSVTLRDSLGLQRLA
jgi:hypothetical protein